MNYFSAFPTGSFRFAALPGVAAPAGLVPPQGLATPPQFIFPPSLYTPERIIPAGLFAPQRLIPSGLLSLSSPGGPIPYDLCTPPDLSTPLGFVGSPDFLSYYYHVPFINLNTLPPAYFPLDRSAAARLSEQMDFTELLNPHCLSLATKQRNIDKNGKGSKLHSRNRFADAWGMGFMYEEERPISTLSELLAAAKRLSVAAWTIPSYFLDYYSLEEYSEPVLETQGNLPVELLAIEDAPSVAESKSSSSSKTKLKKFVKTLKKILSFKSAKINNEIIPLIKTIKV